MPVIGSRRVLKCAMVHDGFTRRSDCAFEDLIRSGMSAALPNVDMMEMSTSQGGMYGWAESEERS